MNLAPPDLPLESERLILRDYVARDWRAVHRYNARAAFWRYLPIEPQTPETTKAFIAVALEQQRQRPRVQYNLAAVLRSSHTVIGGARIGITGAGEASLGYAFDPDHWGQGCATEAVRRLVALGFEHFGLHRISAVCDPGNTGSIRVLEKAGMRREGLLRQNLLVRGKWRDSYLYAVVEGDLRQFRRTPAKPPLTEG
ncbi:MAG: GNAT family N-acetyltransferase [Alphaproteobacteria bacterium]